MTGSRILVELVVVLGTAAVVTVVFQALRLPVVLGYVLAGLLIGPHVPVPLVASASLVHLIAAATLAPRFALEVGLTGTPARVAIVALAAAVATPFLVSLVRRIVVISRLLALEIIPASDATLDLGRAPRRAMLAVFELGLGLLVVVPVVAATQPFVPGGPIVIGVVVLGLVLLARRSLRDFDGHVRAGSELILELLSQPREAQRAALGEVEHVLPGFGGLASITLTPTSPAIGRSLADLDLRAQTGATVLAIARGRGGMATPSPTELLRVGDALALAGSAEAISAARDLLELPGTAAT